MGQVVWNAEKGWHDDGEIVTLKNVGGRIVAMPDFDAEFTVELTERHATPFRVEIEKVGGGTVGRTYEGNWAYVVTDLNTGAVVARGQDLHTGTPKTHAMVALIVSDFVADGE